MSNFVINYEKCYRVKNNPFLNNRIRKASASYYKIGKSSEQESLTSESLLNGFDYTTRENPFSSGEYTKTTKSFNLGIKGKNMQNYDEVFSTSKNVNLYSVSGEVLLNGTYPNSKVYVSGRYNLYTFFYGILRVSPTYTEATSNRVVNQSLLGVSNSVFTYHNYRYQYNINNLGIDSSNLYTKPFEEASYFSKKYFSYVGDIIQIKAYTTGAIPMYINLKLKEKTTTSVVISYEYQYFATSSLSGATATVNDTSINNQNNPTKLAFSSSMNENYIQYLLLDLEYGVDFGTKETKVYSETSTTSNIASNELAMTNNEITPLETAKENVEFILEKYKINKKIIKIEMPVISLYNNVEKEKIVYNKEKGQLPQINDIFQVKDKKGKKMFYTDVDYKIVSIEITYSGVPRMIITGKEV